MALSGIPISSREEIGNSLSAINLAFTHVEERFDEKISFSGGVFTGSITGTEANFTEGVTAVNARFDELSSTIIRGYGGFLTGIVPLGFPMANGDFDYRISAPLVSGVDGLFTGNGLFAGSVSATNFYGDGSKLTGVATNNLSLSAGTIYGSLVVGETLYSGSSVITPALQLESITANYDPFFDNVTFLTRNSGALGSLPTNLVDPSVTFSVSGNVGIAALSSNHVKFNPSSFFFNCSGYVDTALSENKYLKISGYNFNFNNSDPFVMEFWVYVGSYPDTTNGPEGIDPANRCASLIDTYSKQNNSSFGQFCLGLKSDGSLILHTTTAGSFSITGAVLPLGKWTHVIFQKENSYLYVGVDGVRTQVTAVGSIVIDTLADGAFYLGGSPKCLGFDGGEYGLIDTSFSDFRITVGNARYTTNPYTVPQTYLPYKAGNSIVVNTTLSATENICTTGKFIGDGSALSDLTILDNSLYTILSGDFTSILGLSGFSSAESYITTSSDGQIASFAFRSSGPGGAGPIYVSTNFGTTWNARTSNYQWKSIAASTDGSIQLASTSTSLYISTDIGSTWTELPRLISETPALTATNIVKVIMSSDGVVQLAIDQNTGIWRSADAGATWTLNSNVYSIISANALYRPMHTGAFSSDGSTIIVFGNYLNYFISKDLGVTWSAKKILNAIESSVTRGRCAISSDGKIIVLGYESNPLYISPDSGNSWEQVLEPRDWTDVTMSLDGKTIIATAKNTTDPFVISKNFGKDWYNVNVTNSGAIYSVRLNSNATRIFYGDPNILNVIVPVYYDVNYSSRTLQVSGHRGIIANRLGIGTTQTLDRALTVVGDISARGNINTSGSLTLTGALSSSALTVYNPTTAFAANVTVTFPSSRGPQLQLAGLSSADIDLVATNVNRNVTGTQGDYTLRIGAHTETSGITANNCNFNIATSATPVFTITREGNVGIGTTTPNTTLTVVGSLSVTGSVGSLSGTQATFTTSVSAPALSGTYFGDGSGLTGVALTNHTHTKSQITDFAHTHAISDVTNLQTSLDAKLNLTGGTLMGGLALSSLPTIIQLGADINGEAASDSSGYSVSMNSAGDRVAIGAPYNSSTDSGHVRIYSWNGTAWTQLGADIDGEAASDSSGYSVSMNAAGDRVAIGAPYNDGNGAESGHVRIYSWNGTTWTQLGADIDGEAAGDQLGTSVSLNAAGDRVAIGAIANDGNGADSGHVRIFSWNGTAWTQLGADIDGEAAGDQSGWSVSINSAGDRVAIGAPYNDGNGTDSGHVRIYSWNGTAWTQLGADINGEAADDQSGYSVSLNAAGDRVAIGARYNSGNGFVSGHVRIYSWNGTTWTQLGADINGEGVSDASGYSVSINAAGDRVAIGAPYNDGNGSNSGHVRLYSWNGTAWTQLGADINGEGGSDTSGYSVSMNAAGDRVAIGAPYNDGNGSNSGHVRIYTFVTPSTPLVGTTATFTTSVSAPALSGTFFGDGSKLTGINFSAYAPLSGATFTSSISAPALSGTFFGDGSNLTGLNLSSYAPLSGATFTSSISAPALSGTHFGDGSNLTGLNLSSYAPLSGATFTSSISAPALSGTFFGDGSNLTGITLSDATFTSSVAAPVFYGNGAKLGGILTGSKTWLQLGTDINGEATGDNSGHSVSINAAGDVVAIGAPYNDAGGVSTTNRGHVRIYYWNGTAWNQLGTDINGDAAQDEFGSTVSLNAAGNIVAIGTPAAGYVKVYLWTGTIWTQISTSITGTGGFGRVVSLNAAGDRIAIGNPLEDAPGINSPGATQVFYLSGGWNSLGTPMYGKNALDVCGWAVALNAAGDRVVMGAFQNDQLGANSNNGMAMVYSWNGTTWTQMGQDLYGNVGSWFGRAVSINAAGDIIAVVADIGNYVAVYSWNGQVWTQMGTNITGSVVSASLNADGDILSIGNINNNQTKIYYWNGTTWLQLGTDINGEAAGDNSGYSVALNAVGDRVAIGAPLNDAGGSSTNNRGHVRVYNSINATPSLSGTFYGNGSNLSFNGAIFNSNYTSLIAPLRLVGSTGSISENFNLLFEAVTSNETIDYDLLTLSSTMQGSIQNVFGNYAIKIVLTVSRTTQAVSTGAYTTLRGAYEGEYVINVFTNSNGYVGYNINGSANSNITTAFGQSLTSGAPVDGWASLIATRETTSADGTIILRLRSHTTADTSSNYYYSHVAAYLTIYSNI